MAPMFGRKTALIVFSGAMLIVGGCKSDNLKTLTVDEVASRVAAKDGHTFVYDDNPQDRYTKGHVPGAKWLEREPTQADLPADKGATLIFYCASEL
jgi:3-mercaptopyruvate sulfurtransferase SseA